MPELRENKTDCDLSQTEMQELLRRRNELEANPRLAQPMDEEYFARLKCDIPKNAVTKKFSA
jgi:hypothetical protein